MTAPDDPKRDVVPLGRQYEPEVKAVVYRIADRSHWPLIVGDAVHNFRSALDHAWWQCACKKLRRKPTEKEARQIQFPIRSPGGEWDPNKHLQWVEPGVVKIAKIEQPSKGWNLSKFHPLGSLNRLSNVDKHRELTIFVVVRSRVQSLTAPHCRYRDCTPSSDPAGGIASLSLPPESADAGEEVARFSVIPNGPHPDVDAQATLTAAVTIGGKWPLIESLDRIGATVAKILRQIEPRL